MGLYKVQSVKNPNPDPSSQLRDFVEDLSYRPKHTLPFLGVQPRILRGYIDSPYPNTQGMVYHEPFNLIETNFLNTLRKKIKTFKLSMYEYPSSRQFFVTFLACFFCLTSNWGIKLGHGLITWYQISRTDTKCVQSSCVLGVLFNRKLKISVKLKILPVPALQSLAFFWRPSLKHVRH